MTETITGSLDGADLRVAVVVARFNKFVTLKLLDGAKKCFKDKGVEPENILIVEVPGSFEIPLIASKLASSSRYDAIVCIGAVIKGETDHYEHVSKIASEGILNVAMSTGVPVTFGVLTTENTEQALARAGGDHGNVGYEAAEVAIEMANLMNRISEI
ncbi:MAG: 6,7-dimethyl-8-ribityllumazine synthase [Dehalococcoidia bacterium]|nr:6,7-dimethyl-8-ribityllumazine synthase [Dehalococcoidia bacterium]